MFVCVLDIQWDVRESGEVSVCVCVRYRVGCDGVRRGVCMQGRVQDF